MNAVENVEKTQEEKNKIMEKHHLEEMKERARAMTNADRDVVLKSVSDEMLAYEVLIRLTFANGKLKQIRDILMLPEE